LQKEAFLSQPECSEESHTLIGVDVGGTNIRAMAVDQNLMVQGHLITETDTRSNATTLDSIAWAIEGVLSQVNIDPARVSGVGVGVPGQVEKGIVKLAVNLNLDGYPLASALSKRFTWMFELENDVRAAALGAHHFMAEREPIANLAYLSVGTGISAGLILNGELYRGSHGMAGEIGHMVVAPGGPNCTCGSRGCLEAVASGRAIARMGREAVADGKETILVGSRPLTSEIVYEAARQNDAVAEEIIRIISAYLARAVHWLIMTYDVEKVVLGGGVSHSSRAFLDPILSELRQLASYSDLASSMISTDKVALLPKDYDAGCWGAVLLAQRMTKKQKLGQMNR
jgi:glucokinase